MMRLQVLKDQSEVQQHQRSQLKISAAACNTLWRTESLPSDGMNCSAGVSSPCMLLARTSAAQGLRDGA